MSGLRLIAAACAVAFLSVTQVQADGLAGPANLPPSSFEGQQFNDNNGCAYMRAGVSGSTVWVARVDQNREPICGLAPTFGAAPVALAAPVVEAPVVEVEAPVVTAAPRENVGAPMTTVASVTTAPRVTQNAPAAAVEPAAPRQVTLAEACAGRTGVQPGMISSRTGQPIDCGGVPVVAAAAVVAPAAEPSARSMTLLQICTETAATGQVFTDSATGQPVACPQITQTVFTLGEPPPVVQAEALRMTRADVCALSAQNGIRYIDASTGHPINCSVAQGNPSSGLDLGGVEIVTPQTPASNPTEGAIIYSAPPRGYEHVWTDGRLNPNRGFIPISTSQYVLEPGYDRRDGFMPISLSGMRAELANESMGTTDRISSRNVDAMPVAAASGHSFVQVGMYGDTANADRAVATLQGLGLPVGVSTVTQNGAILQIVAAGPFASTAELQTALQAARAAGFGDAYTRG